MKQSVMGGTAAVRERVWSRREKTQGRVFNNSIAQESTKPKITAQQERFSGSQEQKYNRKYQPAEPEYQPAHREQAPKNQTQTSGEQG